MEPVTPGTKLWEMDHGDTAKYGFEAARLSFNMASELILTTDTGEWQSVELSREDAHQLFAALARYLVTVPDDSEEEVR